MTTTPRPGHRQTVLPTAALNDRRKSSKQLLLDLAAEQLEIPLSSPIGSFSLVIPFDIDQRNHCTHHSIMILEEIQKENRTPCFRGLITEIERNATEQRLTLFCRSTTPPEITVLLKDEWSDLVLDTGIYASVIGKLEPGGQITVDTDQNLFILHPDLLITATTLSSMFPCARKAVIFPLFIFW